VNGFVAKTEQRKMRTEAKAVGLNGAVNAAMKTSACGHDRLIGRTVSLAWLARRRPHNGPGRCIVRRRRTNRRPTPLFDVVMRLTTIVDPLCIAIIRHVDVTLRRRRRRRFCCQNRIYFHLPVAFRPPGSMTHA